MTIDISGYTVGANQPLNHARILYSMLSGTVAGDGTNNILAANDYTAQRWIASSGGFQKWQLLFATDQSLDSVVIAAHNLAGNRIEIYTAATIGGAETYRSGLNPVPDNSTIFLMFNTGAGVPVVVRQITLLVYTGTGVQIGIIRAGVALQMPIPIYGGHKPLGHNRVSEGQHLFSETGQWLGRTAKRLAQTSNYAWDHVKSDWYAANFEPFAKTLPLKPFAIAGNPLRMPEDVGWCFTNSDVDVAKMGVRDYCTFALNVTGFAG